MFCTSLLLGLGCSITHARMYSCTLWMQSTDCFNLAQP